MDLDVTPVIAVRTITRHCVNVFVHLSDSPYGKKAADDQNYGSDVERPSPNSPIPKHPFNLIFLMTNVPTEQAEKG